MTIPSSDRAILAFVRGGAKDIGVFTALRTVLRLPAQLATIRSAPASDSLAVKRSVM